MTGAVPALSIRTRLLALTLALLVIPYVGYRYVQEMEGFLRAGLEEALLGGARALAGALHGRDGLFPQTASSAADIHAQALASAPQLDGYDGEWQALSARTRNLIWQSEAHAGEPPPRLTVGRHAGHLYLLLDVIDASQQAPQSGDPLSGDHLVLRVVDAEGQRHHYLIDSSESGPLQALELLRDRLGQPQTRRELRIQGVERRSDSGYALELRIPLALIGERFGLSVLDADTGARAARHASTAPPDTDIGLLVLPSDDIAGIIAALGSTPGRRVWVVDARGRILARGGSLQRDRVERNVPALLAMLLDRPSASDFTDPGTVDRLDSDEVRAALDGHTATRWRASSSSDLYVVSAAHPVWSADRVVGAVLVEESSAPIQTARSKALAELFASTLLVFALAGLALALYASSLSRRLRRLLGEAQGAIDRHGRVVGGISARHGRDEIGELAGGFRDLLERLAQYNRYLERLASRLSHELRTPLAVIRSSLDNLELEHGQPAPAADGPSQDSAAAYLRRAREGVQRLQSIITRMSEVTRIEEAVRSADDGEHIDLAALLEAAVAGYRDTWPQRHFDLRCGERPAPFTGNPDLLVQMLDKLVANALDFAAPDTPIGVRLEQQTGSYRLTVRNEGSRLPEAPGARLFESMVSVRGAGRDAEQPHLGLGLYIVRLICEGHGGSVRAVQHESPQAVSFEVDLPVPASAERGAAGSGAGRAQGRG